MIIKIDKSDIIWTYLSRFLRIGQGLVLLPLILRKLPTDQIAVWALYSTIAALVSVFDLGFSNVFSRNASQILSGKNGNLSHSDSSSNEFGAHGINGHEFKNLISIMKKYYTYISVIILFSLLTFGTLYLYKISAEVENKIQLYLSWIFLIANTMLNFFYNYIALILQSKGLIKETQKINVIGIVLSLTFAVIGVLLGWGLIAITFAGFISMMYNRFFFYRIYNKEIIPLLPRESVIFRMEYFKQIWKTTYKVSLASISSLVIYRCGVIIISLFLPLKEAGSFAFSVNLAFILSEVSFMFFYSHLPQLYSMSFHNDVEGQKKIYLSGILVSVASFTFGGGILILFGNQILGLIGSNMLLIPTTPFIIVFLILLLDQIQNMSTDVLFSSDKLSYMWGYIISALLIVVFTFIFCKIHPSYLAAVIPQFLIQLAYNNWVWPYQVIKKLGIQFVDFKKSVKILN